jgi:hypothetical protein
MWISKVLGAFLYTACGLFFLVGLGHFYEGDYKLGTVGCLIGLLNFLVMYW